MLPHEMVKNKKARFKGAAVTTKVPALRMWRRAV